MSKDRLFELIHTLNRSEKRYFKQFSKRHSEKKNTSKLILLFDYLSQSTSYNAAELVSSCDFIGSNQLQNMRVRLYDSIMASIRNYYASTSPKIILHQLMINHEVLVLKGLYEQAWKLLQKAEAIALENEVFFILEDILHHQEYLTTTRLKNKEIKKSVAEIQERKIKVGSMKNDLAYLDHMGQELYNIFKSEGRFIRTKEYQDKVYELIKATENRTFNLDSFQVSFSFHYNLSLGYRLIGELEKGILHCEKIQPLFSTEANIIRNPKKYQKFLNLHVILCNSIGDFDLAQELIAKIRSEQKHFDINKDMQIIIFENAVFQEIEAFLQQKNFEKAVSIIEENEETINELKNKIHTVNQQSKFYRIALAYFGLGDTRTALKWVNRIINLDEIRYRKDILSSVEILNLLIHYELKNFDLLINRIKTTKQHLKKIDRFLFPEHALTLALNQIVDHKKAEKEIFIELSTTLKENEQKFPLDKYTLAYFNLTDWLDKKIST